jgi:hypothetical protein
MVSKVFIFLPPKSSSPPLRKGGIRGGTFSKGELFVPSFVKQGQDGFLPSFVKKGWRRFFSLL